MEPKEQQTGDTADSAPPLSHQGAAQPRAPWDPAERAKSSPTKVYFVEVSEGAQVRRTPITGRASRAKRGQGPHICDICEPPKESFLLPGPWQWSH